MLHTSLQQQFKINILKEMHKNNIFNMYVCMYVPLYQVISFRKQLETTQLEHLYEKQKRHLLYVRTLFV